METAIALYDKLIARHPLALRKGKTTPYTSLNGHMTSFLSQEGQMGLRLSEKDREEFMKVFKTTLMEQHGRVMKEFVEVPYTLLIATDILLPYLEKSLEYVGSLKPKKSKKK